MPLLLTHNRVFSYDTIFAFQNANSFRGNSDLDVSTGVGPILEAVMIVY